MKTDPGAEPRGSSDSSDARAALEFYQSVFGGDLAVVMCSDAGNVQEESESDHLMWGQVLAANGFDVMACDVLSRMAYRQGP